MTFRNPKLYKIDPLREWIRRSLPLGPDGFVCDDSPDLSIRRFGENFPDVEGSGDLEYFELKTGSKMPGYAQRMLITDVSLAMAKAWGNRWHGYHVLQVPEIQLEHCPTCGQTNPDADECYEAMKKIEYVTIHWNLNGHKQRLTLDELKKHFLRGMKQGE